MVQSERGSLNTASAVITEEGNAKAIGESSLILTGSDPVPAHEHPPG
jgi:hypothetical protein